MFRLVASYVVRTPGLRLAPQLRRVADVDKFRRDRQVRAALGEAPPDAEPMPVLRPAISNVMIAPTASSVTRPRLTANCRNGCTPQAGRFAVHESHFATGLSGLVGRRLSAGIHGLTIRLLRPSASHSAHSEIPETFLLLSAASLS